MDLHKIHHPDNFSFVRQIGTSKKSGSAAAPSARRFPAKTERERLELAVESFGNDVYRLQIVDGRWPERESQVELTPPSGGASSSSLSLSAGGGLSLELGVGKKKQTLLEGLAGATFGVSGDSWMLRFESEEGDRFYGMGEKWGPLEKTGQKSQFWNTDVWADFHPTDIADANVDSPYASIPYLILERDGVFVGILLDNAYRTFMATNPRFWLQDGSEPTAKKAKKKTSKAAPGSTSLFYVGAVEGAASVYFLVGPTLVELTKKLQRLVGTTPRPPLWALGNHQCRWGYGGEDDLKRLDAGYVKHGIPCDGLWLDIDYMDGYRVFTLAEDNFSGITKAGAKSGKPLAELQKLRERGRRIVPILDPGVKVDAGYRIYEEGLKDGHFCLTPSGRPYTGIVWPGLTHFPDFSRDKTRRFWANEVADFTSYGFDGYWIDMNDPSTGPIEHTSMLFDRGKRPHSSFHNQYAWGMASATRAGLAKARPNERPFVLSRSASTGMSQQAAVWTGDNLSSFRHLSRSIPCTINLALSGVPFNGPDVPGFGNDASERLAERWYQAGFLFPFFRNHSIKGSREQEPWAFGAETLEIIRHYVRLRYRLLPFLYQAFIAQEKDGSPILGPAFLNDAQGLRDVDDEFLVGSQLLFAPITDETTSRKIRLPQGDWFCLREGKLHAGASEFDSKIGRAETGAFVRSGSIVPVASLDAIEKAGCADSSLLRQIELHVFLQEGEEATCIYELDDGISLDYRKGQVRRYEFSARREGDELQVRAVEITTSRAKIEGLTTVRFVDYGGATELVTSKERVALRAEKVRWTGKPIAVRAADVTVA